MLQSALSIIGRLVLAFLVFASTCAPLYAWQSDAPCKIEEKYHATCRYDDSGVLQYWVFSIRSPKEFSRLTAITGYPAILETQKAYDAEPIVTRTLADAIAEEWNRNNLEFDLVWKGSGSTQKPNRVSPYTPIYRKGGYEYADTWDINKAIDKQFAPWVVSGTLEDIRFPPRRVGAYPGTLNFETLRVPLYSARNVLPSYWVRFWRECWERTPDGKSYDGCDADLGDYISGAAFAKASSKSYPTYRTSEKAKVIAEAVDAARQFHEITSELKKYMHPDRWVDTGVESTHVELDDVPSELWERIRLADRELTYALLRVRGAFIE